MFLLNLMIGTPSANIQQSTYFIFITLLFYGAKFRKYHLKDTYDFS